MRKPRVPAWEPRFVKYSGGYLKVTFYDDDRKRHQRRLGTKDLNEAYQLYLDLKAEIQGKAKADPYKAKGQTSLSGAFDLIWEEDWQYLSDSQGKRQHINEILKFFGASTELQDITSNEIRKFIAHLRIEKENSNSTINRKLSVLKRLFNVTCNDWEVIDFKPHMPQFKEKRGGHREFIRSDQLRVILSHCLMERYRILLGFLYETGVRFSEAQRLKWDDIDYEHQYAKLRDTKNGEDWIVPLTDEAMKYLQRLPVNLQSTIFHGCTQKTLNQEWNRGREVLGQSDNPKFTPYALRHTFARTMLRKGFSTAQVRAWLHHKSLQTTESYVQLEDYELLEIRDKLNRRK